MKDVDALRIERCELPVSLKYLVPSPSLAVGERFSVSLQVSLAVLPDKKKKKASLSHAVRL